MKQRLPLVLIEWLDAHSHSGWDTLESYQHGHHELSVLRTISVGFLVRRDKRAITILQSISKVDVSDSITIPVGCVCRVRRLRMRGKELS